jgi:hypothetical protein
LKLICFLTLLAGLTGCSNAPPAPPSEIGQAPDLHEPGISVIPSYRVKTDELDAMLADANAAIATWQQAGREGVPPQLVAVRATELEMLARGKLPPATRLDGIQSTSALPVGGGWIAALRFEGASWSRNRFVRREADLVRIYDLVPQDVAARTRVVRTAATAWEDPDLGQVTIDVDMVIEAADRNGMLLWSLLESWGRTDSGVDAVITAAEIEGGGRWTMMGDLLIVETLGPGVPTRLRFRVRTELSNPALLAVWLPEADVHAPFELDLVIADRRVPLKDKTDIYGPYVPLLLPGGEPVVAPPGWLATRYRGRQSTPLLSIARLVPDPPIEIVVGGTRVILAEDFATCPVAIAEIIARLPGVGPRSLALGDSPASKLVVDGDSWSAEAHYGGGVIIGYPNMARWVCEGIPRAVHTLMHELVHAWRVPGLVPAGSLTESLTNYLTMTWATPDEQRADVYLNDVSAARDPGIAVAAPLGHYPETSDWMRYVKGPLVLRAVERDLGKPMMDRALDDFFVRRRGLQSSWNDLADSFERVGGAEAGATARKRFADRGWPGAW